MVFRRVADCVLRGCFCRTCRCSFWAFIVFVGSLNFSVIFTSTFTTNGFTTKLHLRDRSYFRNGICARFIYTFTSATGFSVKIFTLINVYNRSPDCFICCSFTSIFIFFAAISALFLPLKLAAFFDAFPFSLEDWIPTLWAETLKRFNLNKWHNRPVFFDLTNNISWVSFPRFLDCLCSEC